MYSHPPRLKHFYQINLYFLGVCSNVATKKS